MTYVLKKNRDSCLQEARRACIGFIGSVGIPNCYGGFEAFLEAILPLLPQQGINAIVTCDAARYQNRETFFLGVQRVFLNVSANGAISTWHDFLAFCKIFRKVDAVVVLGVSAGPFFLLMRLFTSLFGKQLLINIDGVEWRRGKYSRPVQWVLWFFDLCAQVAATKIIYDNEALLPYVYNWFRKKAICIAYSGDHVLKYPISSDQSSDYSALTICRIEPENNIEMLIQGAIASQLTSYTIIGNWDHSAYGQKIRSKYANIEKLTLLDPIYDPQRIAQYRDSCRIYLHGHSVGGTNPSLVEMLFYRCNILCFDCAFNRETTANNAYYFSDQDSLLHLINGVLHNAPELNGNFNIKRFLSSVILSQYLQTAGVD